MKENKKPENPSAFAAMSTSQYSSNVQKGMSLRDYFATASIQGILSAQTAMRSNGAQNNHFSNQIESICQEAYQIADEMLKQREL